MPFTSSAGPPSANTKLLQNNLISVLTFSTCCTKESVHDCTTPNQESLHGSIMIVIFTKINQRKELQCET
jgi:hypothetical protein